MNRAIANLKSLNFTLNSFLLQTNKKKNATANIVLFNLKSHIFVEPFFTSFNPLFLDLNEFFLNTEFQMQVVAQRFNDDLFSLCFSD